MSSKSNPEIIDLKKLISIMIDNKRTIATTTLLATILGTGYAVLSTPIYRADALVQVEEKSNALSALSEVSDVFNQEASSSTEIEIIKSRMILGKTVEELDLQISVKPNYFPIFGKGISRILDNVNNLNVETFELEEGIYDVSVDGNRLDITSDGVTVSKDTVGLYYVDKKVYISDVRTDSVDSFTITKVQHREAVDHLKSQLQVSEVGKQTGILKLSLTGESKPHITKVLDSITNNYVQQNIERASIEAKKSLTFLENQLPVVQKKLINSENKLNLYRTKNKSVDLGLEAKSTLELIVNIESQLNELTFKESEISQKFTKSHPSYIALNEKRQTLLSEREKLNSEVNKLPETQREILRLSRDVEVNQQIYVAMQNKIQELEVTQASSAGNVRVIDEASAEINAIKPKKSLIVLASIMFGALFGSGIALVRSIMSTGIKRPEELEEIGLSVYATIPLSEQQRDIESTLKHKLLAQCSPNDLSIEAIRSLRTSLHFSQMDATNNVIMITGSTPEVGKSFVSANLAKVISESGKKVLLIDADLRRGSIADYCGLDNHIGLSDLLRKTDFDLSDAIQKIDDKFHVVTRGTTPPNPSELLMHFHFADLIELVHDEYDYVIIDTPPVLAVTDAVIVGAHCGTTLMVGRFDETSMKEVQIAKDRFESNGVNVKGFVLNGVVRTSSEYYGYIYNYGYESK